MLGREPDELADRPLVQRDRRVEARVRVAGERGVDDGVGAGCTPTEDVAVGQIAAPRFHAGGSEPAGRRRRSGQAHHVVALCHQSAGDRTADDARAAGEEDPHRRCVVNQPTAASTAAATRSSRS